MNEEQVQYPMSSSVEQETMQDILDRLTHIESMMELASGSEVGKTPVQLDTILHEVKKANALLGKLGTSTEETGALPQTTKIQCTDITVRLNETLVQEYPIREDDYNELRKVEIAPTAVRVVEYSNVHKKERHHLILNPAIIFWS